MEVKAISTPNFKGSNYNRINNRKQSVENDYPQMDAPVSKNTSKAMRDLTLGLMALGAVSQGLTSCQAEATASASASSSATAVAIGGHCHHRDTVTIINKEDVHYYDAPEIVEDDSNEKVVQTTLYIKTLSFDRKIKWKLFNSRYGNINVLIADEVFLHNVEKNIEQFSKDDKLEVILYIEKIENKYGKPKYMYIIKKVIKHIPYHEEPELPF